MQFFRFLNHFCRDSLLLQLFRELIVKIDDIIC